MDQKAYARMDKLRKRRSKLKAEKDYVLSRIRKYPVSIQRAAIKDIWLKIMDVERQIDEITLNSTNTAIAADAFGLVSRTLPIGARESADPDAIPDSFGFWRADNSSLIKAFGALRADLASYIDDIPLPGLFAGPFNIKIAEGGDVMKYMILLDEASAWTSGGASIRMLPEIAMEASRLSLQKDDEHLAAELEYKRRKGEIEENLGKMLVAKAELGGIAQDAAGAYLQYRKAYAEAAAEKYGLALGEKEIKTVERLRKRFGLRKEFTT